MAAYDLLRIGIAAVPLIHMAMPRAMPIMASVVRKDGMPMPVVSHPLIAPTITPVPSPQRMPPAMPNWSIPMAVATDAKPATAPTDRSISPVQSTKVIVTETTAMIAVCRTMFKRLFGSRKPLSPNVAAKTRKITTKPI
jgi:hypothetical protein